MKRTLNTNPLLRLLILFNILTLSIPIYSRTTTTDLITATCNQTPDPNLCQAVLGSDPRSSETETIEGLILIMVDVVKTGFSDSLQYVKELSKKARDPDIIPALQECIWVYKVVVETSVELAVKAVKQGVPKFGEKAMADAGMEAQLCMMGFPEGKVPGRIMGWTRMLQGVCNVAASMIKILE